MVNNKNKKDIYNYMIQKGFSDNAAAGIMGNIGVETGYTYDYKQKQKGGQGEGLFQFDFMKPYYKDYLKQNNLKDSMESQVDFVHETIYGNQKDVIGAGRAKTIADVFNSGSVEDASNIFLDEFERPKNPEATRKDRTRIAQESLDEYSVDKVEPLSTNVDTSQMNMLDGARKFMQNELGPRFTLRHVMQYGFGMQEELNEDRNKEN